MLEKGRTRWKRVILAIAVVACFVPLIGFVGCFLWLFGHTGSQFDSFAYELEYPDGNQVVLHSAAVWRRDTWEPDGFLRYRSQRSSATKPSFAARPYFGTERDATLTSEELRAVGDVATAWIREHQSMVVPPGNVHKDEPDPYERWAVLADTPFTVEHEAPRLYLSITKTVWREYGPHWGDESCFIAQGPEECAKVRSLIEAVNRGLPASARQRFALPLPPQAPEQQGKQPPSSR